LRRCARVDVSRYIIRMHRKPSRAYGRWGNGGGGLHRRQPRAVGSYRHAGRRNRLGFSLFFRPANGHRWSPYQGYDLFFCGNTGQQGGRSLETRHCEPDMGLGVIKSVCKPLYYPSFFPPFPLVSCISSLSYSISHVRFTVASLQEGREKRGIIEGLAYTFDYPKG
jgi:hypothetical protein